MSVNPLMMLVNILLFGLIFATQIWFYFVYSNFDLQTIIALEISDLLGLLIKVTLLVLVQSFS
jgi:hypothetical protein